MIPTDPDPPHWLAAVLRNADPELFPGSGYKTKLPVFVLVWLNLLKNNQLVLKNNPHPGSKLRKGSAGILLSP